MITFEFIRDIYPYLLTNAAICGIIVLFPQTRWFG